MNDKKSSNSNDKDDEGKYIVETDEDKQTPKHLTKTECDKKVEEFRHQKMDAIFNLITQHTAYEKSTKEMIDNTLDKKEKKQKQKEMSLQVKNNRETIRNKKK